MQIHYIGCTLLIVVVRADNLLVMKVVFMWFEFMSMLRVDFVKIIS